MKYLFLILLLSTSAFGEDVWKRYCFPSKNLCFAVQVEGTNKTIYAPPEAVKSLTSNEIKIDFITMGFNVATLTPEIQQDLDSANVPVEQVDESGSPGILASIPDVDFDLFVNGAGCALGAVVCVGTTYEAVVTGGLAIWMARVSCGGTIIACGMAWRSWEKWKIARAVEARKAGNKPSHIGPGSGGGSGEPGTGGQTSGTGSLAPRIKQKCSTTQVKTVTSEGQTIWGPLRQSCWETLQ